MTPSLTDSNYNSIIEGNDSPIFIDFYSPSCGPCQILLSFIDELYSYGSEHGVLVLKCDISKNPKIANKYSIRSVPFSIVVTSDKKIIHPEVGLKDKGYYFSLIEKMNPNKKSFFQKLFGK